MTEAEYQQQLAKGNVNVAKPDATQREELPSDPTFMQFYAILQALRSPRKPLASAPTFIPTSFVDQIQLVDNGTKSLYLYINDAWLQIGGVHVGGATTGQYSSAEYDNGSVSGTATINWNNGNVQYVTLTANTTLILSNPLSGGRYVLHVAGAFTPNFPSGVRWPLGVAPTATATAGKKDMYTFIYSVKESLYDGLQAANISTT